MNININNDFIVTNQPSYKLIKHKALSYDKASLVKHRALAQTISDETTVPFNLIYGKYPWNIRINNWYKINNIWHYYKNATGNNLINELLGEIVSEYFGIDTIHYEMATLINDDGTDQIGLISKNFCQQDSTYKTIEEYEQAQIIKFSSNDTLDITLSKFERMCPSTENCSTLKSDIKKLFIRDFFATEIDRGTGNLLFRERNNNVFLAPLYDYEESFLPDEYIIQKYINCIGKIDINDSRTLTFLKQDYECQQLINLLLAIDMNNLLSSVESRHHIILSENKKAFYMQHSNKMKKIIKEKIC